MKMRRCSRCKRLRSLDAYHRDRSGPDGRARRCKACVSEQTAAWARRNRAQKNATDAAFKRRRRDRDRAHGAVKRAISRGQLERPDACERVGFNGHACEGPIEAHHDDYARPLDVAWLCKLHHGIAQEMYHRGQLVLYERLMGIEPALTLRIRKSSQ